MPWSPSKHCPHGHPPFTGPRCPACSAAFRAASEARRPSARERGYSREWQIEAKAYLAMNKTCRRCGAPATVVDHIIAHKGDMRRFWDRSNWQPLCLPCNSRKAIAEEGALGGKGRGAREFVKGKSGPAIGSRAQHPSKWGTGQ